MFFLNLLLVIALSVSGQTFKDKFKDISTIADCEDSPEAEELFGQRDNHYHDATGNIFCFRQQAGVSQMSSTSRLFEDPRFLCSNGPMAWYRGRRNVDFQGRPCLFWNTVPNATFDISDGSSSSYSMKRILPDEFENFCRNPNKSPLGPWCHVENKLRSPCFEPCRSLTEVSSSKFSCLNKEGFPYTEYDMSDILDSPQLIQVFENVHLMYESRYVLSVKEDRLSTKTCINTGQVANYFGPWIAVFNDMAREFIKSVGRKKLRELCAPLPPVTEEIVLDDVNKTAIRDGIIEDELTMAGCTFWRRCFSSCQDDAANCWSAKDQSGYFGTKLTSVEKKECLPWTQVASEILSAVRVNSSSTSKYHIYHALLFEDPTNFFISSRLFLNTEKSCILLMRKSDGEKTGLYPTRFSRDLWDAEFQNMFQKGPGCFVMENKTIGFEQCYSTCTKPSNISLTKKLCLVKGEYEVCKRPRSADRLIRGRKVVKSHRLQITPLITFSAIIIYLL